MRFREIIEDIDDETKKAIDKYQQSNTVGKTSRAFYDIEDEYFNIRELALDLIKNGLDSYTAYYKASEKMQFDPAMVFDWMGSEFKDEGLEDYIPVEYERDWIKRAELGMTENYDHLKGHGTDVPLGKYLYHVTYAEALEGMLEDGHMNVKGPAPFHYADYFSMTADPKYSVAGRPEVQIIIDAARVSKMETFEKYVDDWESTPGAGDWAKGDDGDWESEYRVEETIPLDYIVAVKILKSKTTPEIIKLAKKRGVKLVGKDTNVLENFADGKKRVKADPDV